MDNPTAEERRRIMADAAAARASLAAATAAAPSPARGNENAPVDQGREQNVRQQQKQECEIEPEKKRSLVPVPQVDSSQQQKEPAAPLPSVEKDALTTATAPQSPSPVKRQKRKDPLVQPKIVCQVLAHITQDQVIIRTTKNHDGTDNTASSYKSFSNGNSSSKAAHRLTVPGRGTWKDLTETSVTTAIIKSMILSSKSNSNSNSSTIRRVAALYERAYEIQRHGLIPYIDSKHNDWDDFVCWIRLVLDELVKYAAEQCPAESLNDYVDEQQEEQVEEDLFSSFQSITPSQQQQSSPLSQLASLLGSKPPIRPFWDGLFATHRQKLNNNNNNNNAQQLADAPTDLLANSLMLSLLQQLGGGSGCIVDSNSSSNESLHHSLTAIANALTVSPDLARVLSKRLGIEKDILYGRNLLGNEAEQIVQLGPLFCLAAYTIPDVHCESERFEKDISLLPNYPVCIFQNNQKSIREVDQVQQNSRKLMVAASRVAESALKKSFGSKEKQAAFTWLAYLIRSNESLTDMLQGDLLSPDGVVAISSSRRFLLGMVSSLARLCAHSLTGVFEKQGKLAFDLSYLIADETTRLGISNAEPRLAKVAYSKKDMDIKERFTGATEFFFLMAGLLRVGLYPSLRIELEFDRRSNQTLMTIQDMADSEQQQYSSREFSKNSKSTVASWLGWRTFLRDPELVMNLSTFAILQLQWLLVIAKDDPNHESLSIIPEWMCKQPAQWLAHVAKTQSNSLKPHQGGSAVACAAELLALGSSGPDGQPALFSPVVLTELIRIAAAFVSAGVSRAKSMQRRGKSSSSYGNDEDDRDIDIYHSFDHNDLGVTVFTNQIAITQLCPTLLRTFCSLDIIEGLDVDKEHEFDKHGVKTEISDLLLRLWAHPNGEFRKSIVDAPMEDMTHFASSVAAAIGYMLDDACHRFTDVCSLRNRSAWQLSMQDKQFLKSQSRTMASFLQRARCLLMLLCKLSQDRKISSMLGGDRACAASLATMVIHFLDKLTDMNGNTHPDLDLSPNNEVSAVLSQRVNGMSTQERQALAASLVRARQDALKEFGFNASSLCHLLVALSASWHRSSYTTEEASPFLSSLANHDDCDPQRIELIVRRLIKVPAITHGTEGDNAEAVFEHDGYVDAGIWKDSYSEEKDQATKNPRWISRKDQIKRKDIDRLASDTEIASFVLDLSRLKADSTTGDEAIAVADLERMQTTLINTGDTLKEEAYAANLKEWVVSSTPFASRANDGSYSHYYDASCRNSSSSASGKIMEKEARRCHKTIPPAHPNSATFCCFAEERMDLCRAIVTGPVDTPYACGLFTFDVFYPSTYPQIPPLVTYMTTGGGQTRFHPNLYQDGKVCLSLLGTWHASDDSERWNPKVSSLAQILLSIQTQLLVEEPYFHEPGYERTRGTRAGREGSERYNSKLRLASLRYGILAPLRNPPVGFEEVSLRHFSMCRKRILVQARRWMLEAKDTSLYPRFDRVYRELLSVFSSRDDLCTYDALAPLDSDLAALRRLDTEFIISIPDKDPQQPVAANQPPPLLASSYNPWA